MEHPQSINGHIDNLVKDVQDQSRKLPSKKFRSFLKPYWSNNLTYLSKKCKAARKHWLYVRNSGRDDSEAQIEYKNSKREFRRERRKGSITLT